MWKGSRMTLDSFERELSALIGRPTDLRPFVCEGSPLDCTVFLVGLNPATSMDADFWEFWKSGQGYDKKRWYARYLAERAAKPPKPGRKFRRAVSPTRLNMEAFVEGAGDVRVLETNIYAKASDDLRSLEQKDRETAPFRFLIESIRPKIIVVHGKPAVEEIAKFVVPSRVITAAHHLSYQTSRETARALGVRAAAMAA
jgi:hypothetical protein